MVPYRTNLNLRRRIEREAIIEERRRIAREIHDGVAQSLSYLNLKTKLVSDSVASQNTVQALTELGEIRKVVQDTYEDIRESIDQLSTEIRSLPIIPALANYIREFGDNNGIKVQFDVPKAFPQLSPVAELQLLRITQEALTNVRRHAQATEVGVKLEKTSQAVEMLVKDNGQGFTLSDLEKSPPGYHGLNIIRERAEGLGGAVTIDTAPGEGTEVKVSLPIEKVRL
jgi:signal transduction histidine kinase